MGTALGAVLAGKGFPVAIWDADVAPLETISARHENDRYLPGVPLPETLRAEPDLARALEGAELVVIAVPSLAARPVAVLARPCAPRGHPGLHGGEGRRGRHADDDERGAGGRAARGGAPVPHLPLRSSFAVEVARGAPTAVTVAGRWNRMGGWCRTPSTPGASGPTPRPTWPGLRLAGRAKNVVAIATGLCDGLGLGASARAALITRGLAEIRPPGAGQGCDRLTLLGLSGWVTSCSPAPPRSPGTTGSATVSAREGTLGY